MFLTNLSNGKYFGNSRSIRYAIRVIEYQHRGLPHSHIVIQFSNMPDKNDVPAKINFINTYISAKMPDSNQNASFEDKVYAEYVRTHMRHQCSIAPTNGCKHTATGKCNRGYDDTIECSTHFDDKGYPVYERLKAGDLKVVPHNKTILLDWGGHANVEYAGGSKCILYLYKYLFKGSKKSSLDLRHEGMAEDEISLYLRGRFLCSMDAMWR